LVAVTAAALIVGGCTANFSTLVADRPGCTISAGVPRSKVEQCLGYGNVHRDAFDICLERQQVPAHKIEMLDDCVASESARN
jgi:hypothetical protein